MCLLLSNSRCFSWFMGVAKQLTGALPPPELNYVLYVGPHIHPSAFDDGELNTT